LWTALGADLGLAIAMSGLVIHAFAPGLREQLGLPVLAGAITLGSALMVWVVLRSPQSRSLGEALGMTTKVMTAMPGSVKAQVVLALPTVFIAPMFFLDTVAAQSWLLAQIPNTAIALSVFAAFGPSRLISMAHLIPWLVPLAASVVALSGASGAASLFLWAALVGGSLTLLVDANEMRRWLGGDRRLMPDA